MNHTGIKERTFLPVCEQSTPAYWSIALEAPIYECPDAFHISTESTLSVIQHMFNSTEFLIISIGVSVSLGILLEQQAPFFGSMPHHKDGKDELMFGLMIENVFIESV